MKGKPKFRVGQVVYIKFRAEYKPVVFIGPCGNIPFRYQCACGYWIDEHDLRPLTAREIGPRPARRKGKGK
jgi:hypothetical protein